MKNRIATPKQINIWEFISLTLALVFLVLVLISISLFSYMEKRKTIISDIDKRLFVGAASIKNLLPKDFHDRATASNTISPEEEGENIKALSGFANRTDFKFLYTLIENKNKIYITSSSATEEELDKNEQVRYFSLFDEAGPSFHEAFDEDTPLSFTHKDRWGTFRALALPEKSPDGKKYLSVAEFDISYVNGLLNSKLMGTLISAFLLIFGVMPLIYIFFKRVQRTSETQKKMAKQLLQAQKMESIGTLAGGIAHDFNNILGVILGYTELSLDDVEDRPKTYRSLQEVLKATSRAKDMVSQILTFSRSTDVEKKIIKTIPIVKEACKFLRSSLPTTIEIRQNITAERDHILADPTQFHQILMNLCTNAGHAMKEEGGVLDVALDEVFLQKDDLISYSDLKVGAYLKLTVKDTGTGIRRENIERIFEPYFTTKGKGEGTGLGLAVVHGIVKDHGGDIKAYSEAGKGTTFYVFLPLREEIRSPVHGESTEPPPTGSEKILFLDDEEDLVNIGKLTLERLGYSVTGVTSVEKALEFFRSSKESYDIVITDKTMPKMTGFGFAREIRSISPDIPILLCTGFKEKEDEDKFKDLRINAVITKPINKREIAFAVRKVLDKKPA